MRAKVRAIETVARQQFDADAAAARGAGKYTKDWDALMPIQRSTYRVRVRKTVQAYLDVIETL